MLFDAGTSINRSIQILGVVPSKNRGYAGIGNEIRESPPKTVDFTKRSSNWGKAPWVDTTEVPNLTPRCSWICQLLVDSASSLLQLSKKKATLGNIPIPIGVYHGKNRVKKLQKEVKIGSKLVAHLKTPPRRSWIASVAPANPSGHHRYSQVASICFKPTWLEITEFALKNFYDHRYHRYHRFHEFLDDFYHFEVWNSATITGLGEVALHHLCGQIGDDLFMVYGLPP